MVALSTVLLAGCSGGSESAGDSGSAEGGGSGAGSRAAAAQASEAPPGAEGTGAGAAQAGDRQVVTTGEVSVRVDDPRAAADTITDAVEEDGGRVDARSEDVPPGEDGARPVEGTDEAPSGRAASASLTVRVPSDRVTATVDALRELGEVESVSISSDDVTGAAQDLDARIAALRTSVERLDTLIAEASTTADLITAEQALTDRQASLESLVAERGRLAEQVSLSTLLISLSTQAGPSAQGSSGFVDGLATGWAGLMRSAGVLLVAAGFLLPWALAVGVVAAAVIGARRWLRSRRQQRTEAARPGTVSPAPQE